MRWLHTGRACGRALGRALGHALGQGLSLGLGLGLALACGAGGVARAATFDVLQFTPDVVILLDPLGIENLGDGKVSRRAWTVNVQRSLVGGGSQQPGYVRTQNDYDCVGRNIRWRSFSVYSRFGEVVLHRDNPDPNWSAIDGNPEAAAAARVVCDGKAASSVINAASIGDLVITLMQAWDAAPGAALKPSGGPAAGGPIPKPAMPVQAKTATKAKPVASSKPKPKAKSKSKPQDKSPARR